MHPSQEKFIRRIADQYPHMFIDVMVLDVGSMDINGNNRHHFYQSHYTGVDIHAGANVNLVLNEGNVLPYQDNLFNVVISTECMEHNKYYREMIFEMRRVLRPGGLMIMTMAGVGRPEHGTTKADPVASPFTNDYYKNIALSDLTEIFDFEESFFPFCFEYGGAYDLYFYGIKRIP